MTIIYLPIRYLVNMEDRLVSPTELTNIVETIRGKDVSKKDLDEEESKDKSGYLLNLSDVKDYKIDTLTTNQSRYTR